MATTAAHQYRLCARMLDDWGRRGSIRIRHPRCRKNGATPTRSLNGRWFPWQSRPWDSANGPRRLRPCRPQIRHDLAGDERVSNRRCVARTEGPWSETAGPAAHGACLRSTGRRTSDPRRHRGWLRRAWHRCHRAGRVSLSVNGEFRLQHPGATKPRDPPNDAPRPLIVGGQGGRRDRENGMRCRHGKRRKAD